VNSKKKMTEGRDYSECYIPGLLFNENVLIDKDLEIRDFNGLLI
jgi:hypothetical protein